MSQFCQSPTHEIFLETSIINKTFARVKRACAAKIFTRKPPNRYFVSPRKHPTDPRRGRKKRRKRWKTRFSHSFFSFEDCTSEGGKSNLPMTTQSDNSAKLTKLNILRLMLKLFIRIKFCGRFFVNFLHFYSKVFLPFLRNAFKMLTKGFSSFFLSLSQPIIAATTD